ncbi:unnamed protein product, partial [Ectocarpus sp. 13 AM-2016]
GGFLRHFFRKRRVVCPQEHSLEKKEQKREAATAQTLTWTALKILLVRSRSMRMGVSEIVVPVTSRKHSSNLRFSCLMKQKKSFPTVLLRLPNQIQEFICIPSKTPRKSHTHTHKISTDLLTNHTKKRVGRGNT